MDLPFAAVADPASFTNGRFAERHPHNVPGPFYGAETDTCGTGPVEAPSNVMCDAEYGQEFVFRQPRNTRELAEVERAAWADPYSGHASDGNDHWTPDLVREWWAERDAHRQAWGAAGLPDVEMVFEREVSYYLRSYIFYLTTGRVPTDADDLPTL